MTTRDTLIIELERLQVFEEEERVRAGAHRKMVNDKLDSLLEHFHKITRARMRRWMKGCNVVDTHAYLASDRYENVVYFMSTFAKLIIQNDHLFAKVEETNVYMGPNKTAIMHKEGKSASHVRIDTRSERKYLYVETDIINAIEEWEKS